MIKFVKLRRLTNNSMMSKDEILKIHKVFHRTIKTQNV